MVLASQRAAFPFARSEFTGLAMTAEKKAREAIGDGALRVISDEEFLQRFREGSVQRLSPFVDPDGSRALNPYNRDFLCIPEKARADAERRAKYIDGIVAEAGPPPYSDRRLPELILIVHKTNKDPCTRRATEVAIAIKSLNRMNQLGRAIFTRIA